jgi:predicted oxidoreductase
MMERITLSDNLSLSRFVHGEWRLADWGIQGPELAGLIEEVLDLGITSFDHADIYGLYTCEAIFGDALKSSPGLRDKMEIITKCGIRLVCDKNPGQTIPYYDQSSDHIIQSVENSLTNLGTDRIDLLLIHRPSPLMDPEEIAGAFSRLYKDGKVLNFGVSNFTPIQFETLSEYCEMPLVTNQIEISPYCIEHFLNDNIPFLQQKRIAPMAWSPMAGGQLFHPDNEKAKKVAGELRKVADELNVEGIDKIAYSWLLQHPGNFLPIIGSGKVERIKSAIEATGIKMSTEQWFRIYTASLGTNIP